MHVTSYLNAWDIYVSKTAMGKIGGTFMAQLLRNVEGSIPQV